MADFNNIGRYQQKVRMGLVPFRYDAGSKDHQRGAWKNWERVIGQSYEANRDRFDDHRNVIARRDAEFLKQARAER
jgi:hypothetical protein